MIKKTLIIFFGTLLSIVAYSQTKKNTATDYFKKYAEIAVREMLKTGIPASITLAQGSLESSNGNSDLAKKGNNHFGIKCHKDWNGDTMYKDDDEKNECFRVYKNEEESFTDHSNFLTSRTRYADLFKLDHKDYKGWAYGLKAAGYATNPKYPELLINLIETNKLFEYDNLNKALSKRRKFKLNAAPPPVLVDIDSFTIQLPTRKIKINNKTKYIVAKQGDTYQSIAVEFDLMPWQIYRFNDISRDSVLHPNDVVYIKHKRRNSDKNYFIHFAKPGETLRSISQLYGVKMRRLEKLNGIKASAKLDSLQQIIVHH